MELINVSISRIHLNTDLNSHSETRIRYIEQTVRNAKNTTNVRYSQRSYLIKRETKDCKCRTFVRFWPFEHFYYDISECVLIFFSLSHDILANFPLLFIVVDAMASKYVKYNIQVPYLTPQWKPKDKAFARIKLPHSMKTNLSDSPVITNQLNIRISNCTSSWVSTLLFVTHPFHSDKTIHEAIVQSSSDSYTIYCKLSNKRHVYRCIKHLR